MKNWLIGKDSDTGEDWRQEEKGTTEDKMVAWHHRLNGHEFEQALEVGDGQGSLVCCTPYYSKKLAWYSKSCELMYRGQSGSRQKSLGSSQACGPGGSGERYRWKGRLPILWCRSLNPRKGAQDFECVTEHCFPKNKKKNKNCFLQERELWLSLFSRFYWGMLKGSGVGWVCKNQVTSCWRARLVVDILL